MPRLAILTAAALASVTLVACSGSSTKSSSSAPPPSAAETTTAAPSQNVSADVAAAQSASLKLSDLPSGWTSKPHTDTPGAPDADADLAKCLGVSLAELNKKGPAEVHSDDFSDANNSEASSTISYAPSADKVSHEFDLFSDPRVPGCLTSAFSSAFNYFIQHPKNPTDTLPAGVTIGTVTIAVLPFPTVGDKSIVYRASIPITASGQTLTGSYDLLLAVKGRVGVEMDFGAFQQPFASADEQHYAQLVVGRLTNT